MSTAAWIPKPRDTNNDAAAAGAYIGLQQKPKPDIADAALHGIAGQVVNLIDPHTESAREAVLVQFLVAAGIYLGRTGYYAVEGDQHYTNLFAAVVGSTSKGRKGSSWSQINRILKIADEEFTASNITGGLSSGEGLIWAVRDEIHEHKQIHQKGRVTGYQEVIADRGITDKRLLVVEPEFARVLKVAERDGNILSAVIREGWDSGNLKTLNTRGKGAKATGAHIGIITHITSDELSRLLTTTEAANGFANRFLWILASRSKVLPFGGSLTPEDLRPIAATLRDIRSHAARTERITWDTEAANCWEGIYGPLSSAKPGLFGAVIGRAEAHVVRLALLYALLDSDVAIRRPHLDAALAVWNYAERSARYIFGDALGDATADTILSYLRSLGPIGTTRTGLRDFFGRNKPKDEIDRALGVLLLHGVAQPVKEEHETGRSTERWIAA